MDHQKQGKTKNKILKFLPKAASGVSFHSRPYSPSREAAAKLKPHRRREFSGPLMIPDQIRRKQRSGSFDGQTQEEEPTSPKVSCMGQIKHKKQIKKINRVNLIPKDRQKSKPPAPWSPREIKKHGFTFRRMFSNINPGRKSESDASDLDRNRTAPTLPEKAPSLGQMKRFASGRGHAFENLDWDNIMNNHRDYSDEEREDSDEREEDVRIAFSAPLGIGGRNQFHQVPLQPKKEINLWKRRTMAPPIPLELKPVV